MLKLIPAPGHLVRTPGAIATVGDPAPYFGRRFDADLRGYPASGVVVEVDPDTDAGRQLIRCAVVDGGVLPFDVETAAVIGVPFVAYEHHGGEWEPTATDTPAPVAVTE